MLDATCVVAGQNTGAGRYVRTLAASLMQNDQFNRYAIFGFEPDLFSDLPDNFQYIPLRLRRVLGFLARELARRAFVRRFAQHEPVDVVHSILDYVPAPADRVKTVFTLFDLARLNPLYVEATSDQRWRAHFRTRLRYSSARRADRILTTSDVIRELIAQRLDIKKEKIDRAIIAPNPAFCVGVPKSEVLAKYSLTKRPYVLFVGQFGRQKNEGGLVEEFLKAASEKLQPDAALVLVGNPADMRDDLREKIAGKNNIVIIDDADDAALVHLYRAAECLCLPSFEEGYGLPVLEAMACATPSIVTAGTCLEELAGDAGIAVGVGDSDALFQAIQTMMTNTRLRQTLSQACLKRASNFRYDIMAAAHIACYRKAMNS